MEPALPAIESLYDLLYVDTRRIASYVAQLDPNGTLTGIKLTSSISSGRSAEGKINVAVASGEVHATGSAAEGIERQFDPLWAIPIAAMNRLDELGFIHRGLSSASIGSLVLVTGKVGLINVHMLRDMWPLIGRLIETTRADADPQESHRNRHERRAAEKRSSASAASKKTPFGPMAELVSHLPHALELSLTAEDGNVWCTLKHDYMLTSAEDIALKHGATLAGTWHMLGILDAHPGPIEEAAEQPEGSSISQAMASLTLIVRQQMGRPESAHGMTPLMLFRALWPTVTGPE